MKDDPRKRLQWIAHMEFAQGNRLKSAGDAEGGGVAAAAVAAARGGGGGGRLAQWDTMVESITRKIETSLPPYFYG